MGEGMGGLGSGRPTGLSRGERRGVQEKGLPSPCSADPSTAGLMLVIAALKQLSLLCCLAPVRLIFTCYSDPLCKVFLLILGQSLLVALIP